MDCDEECSPARFNCCLDAAMRVIEGRWKCTILCMLVKEGPMRFSELQRGIGDITSRILSKQLKELEADGMVDRTVADDRKLRVTYSITEKGESIRPALEVLARWGSDHQMGDVPPLCGVCRTARVYRRRSACPTHGVQARSHR